MNYRLRNLTLLVIDRIPVQEGENHRNAPPPPGVIYRQYQVGEIGYRLRVDNQLIIIDLSINSVYITSTNNPDLSLPEITSIEPLFSQESLNSWRNIANQA